MPVGALIGPAISGVTSIISGRSQRRAAERAAAQQAAARAAAQANVTSMAERGMAGVTNAGTEAATGVTNAGGVAAQGITDAANRGQAGILGTLGGYQPYQDAGATAARQSSELTSAPIERFSFDPSSLGMDPGYQFRQREANKAALANGAAFGDLMSGGFARSFQDRNQEAASQEMDKVYGRQRDTFTVNQGQTNSRVSQLAQLMGFGQNAQNAVTGATTDAARLGYQGATDAGQFGTDAARLAGGFGTQAAQTAAGLGADASRLNADLTVGAGDANAVGTINANNAQTGMLGNIGRAAAGIDWGSLFNRSSASSPSRMPITPVTQRPGMADIFRTMRQPNMGAV
jgi:hypothetical protein